MSNELATTEKPAAPAIVQLLQDATTLESIEKALPRSIAPERFLRQAQTLARTTPALLKCPPAPLLGAMIEAAQLGLELSTFLGEAYIVPFWSGRDRCLMPTLIPGYKGLVKLVREGEFIEVYAHVVRNQDEFEMELGTAHRLVHKPDPYKSADERGAIVGAYAVAKTTRGGIEFEWMSVHDLDEIKDAARSKVKEQWQWEKSPWFNHEEQMYRKTALRRLCNRLPKSDRAARAVQLAAMAEGGEPEIIHLGDARISDTEVEPVMELDALNAAGGGEPDEVSGADGFADAPPATFDAEESRRQEQIDAGLFE